MKKIVSIFMVIICFSILFTSCTNTSYGEAFNSQDELKTVLQEKQIELKYPSSFPNGDHEKAKFNYISNRNIEEKKEIGYKIYCFSEPFNTAVYGYDFETTDVQSENSEFLTKAETLNINGVEFQLYEGIGHKDSIFFIASGNIDGKHYECRIVGNETTKDGDSINYIFKSNDNYEKALGMLKTTFENLK